MILFKICQQYLHIFYSHDYLYYYLSNKLVYKLIEIELLAQSGVVNYGEETRGCA